MIQEVRINVTFVTGTTQEDPEQAKKVCLKLLRDLLKKAFCCEGSEGLFAMKINSIESEDIR